ncbi:hypothetical protein [Arthrobacter sp. IK3]|uniref:hypothetical protein n=1 Tax=Arthrobacter sp. IK3 TaxID=3448169 RepID=UPI003EE0406D
MSERTFKDRIKSERDKDKQEIEDWMAGSGSKVFGIAVVVLAAWFIINIFV